MSATDARWESESVRLFRRYESEIVAAYGLCPWASPVRREGRVREVVFLQSDMVLEPSLRAIDALDDGIDIGVFLYPRLKLERSEFDAFAGQVRDAEVSRRPLGGAPFVFAAFHPNAVAHTGDAERLIPFLRRTPDATLQLLRVSVLDRARGGGSQGTKFVDLRSVGDLQPEPMSLRERVAHTNLATALRVGVDRIKRDLDDILRDREASHRVLEEG